MNDETTGSLDTNVRLLAQRVTATEIDLHRLGDSVRDNTRDLSKIEANMSKDHELLEYRVNQVIEDKKEASRRYWGLFCGLTLSILISLWSVFIKRI